ncbi:MAG: hypothetical protein QNJ72_22870 [Pleurocapsa sp. MO_226.B13]|nr:hypothetical protein [Pleurocapsa sp. MO_226.B13]
MTKPTLINYLIYALNMFDRQLSLFNLFLGLFTLTLTNATALPGQAEVSSIPTQTYDLVGEDNQSQGTVKVPDFSSINFGSLGSFDESGFISDAYDRYAGYKLGREWSAGDLVVDTLKLGDLEEGFGIGQLSLGDIVTKSGRELEDVTLDRFGFLEERTVAEFIEANPQLENEKIKNIPPLADLVEQEYGSDSSILDFSANNLADRDGAFGDVSQSKLGDRLDLSQYNLADVSGLEDSQIQNYEGWRDSYISDLEGLADISLDDLPNPIASTLAFISRVDAIWSNAEGQVKAGFSVSGSNVSGYAVPCNQECAYIELDDLENSGRNIRWVSEGRRWILGNDPNNGNICPEAPWGVDGGEGILGNLNCGKEPTGRNSFGPAFKVALWKVDETTDTAETAIFFRICKRGIPDLGCTPYFIGPIPWLPANRESWIILGPGI